MKPYYNYVLIEKLKSETTKSGVILPNSAKKNKQKGTIIAIGQECTLLTKADIKKQVIYASTQDDSLFYEDDNYVIVVEEAVLAEIK